MNMLLDVAYRIQKRLWRLLHPSTRGVKVMLFNESGEILLIRNSYGNSALFVLPGGGVRPWEKPDAAASREVREELGCEVEGLRLESTHFSRAEGKRDRIHLFSARAGGSPRADGYEVKEARYFPLDRLPASLSPATARRIAEYRGAVVPSPDW